MDIDRLRRVDLNLLVAFAALVEEESVTRAARRLRLSQPATSAALARLRGLFDDPLLVRRDGRMQPTARAERLRERVAVALGHADAVLEPDTPFDPAQAERAFDVLLADYAAELLLPPLTTLLAAEAPRVTLRVRTGYLARVDDRREGELDAWVLSEGMLHPRHPHATLLEDRWVVVGSGRFHRASSRPLDDARLRALRFVIGDERVEQRLGVTNPHSRRFRQRVRPALVYDHWDCQVLCDTPLVRLVPARLASGLGRGLGLVVVGTVRGAPPHRLVLQWPASRADDAAGVWLRGALHRAAARAGRPTRAR